MSFYIVLGIYVVIASVVLVMQYRRRSTVSATVVRTERVAGTARPAVIPQRCRCGDVLTLSMTGWIDHRMQHEGRGFTYWGDKR